jgi:YHS domain-containing protein
MRPFVRVFFAMSALHLGAGAGTALAQSAPVQEPAVTKPEKPADAKKPDEAKKATDANKPEAAKKAADSKKPAEVYKSAEIYQSAATFLGSKFAVGGYDTVAYHTDKKPVPGTDEFTHMWKGATWRFASKENLDAFVKEPEKYAPQYGGYCAFAVGHGSLASGDPKIWKIVDGKLYLNLNKSIQTSWERDIPGLTKRADANWPKVLK